MAEQSGTRPLECASVARVVERGRARAAELGELTPRSVGPIESVFTDGAREIVADWKRDADLSVTYRLID